MEDKRSPSLGEVSLAIEKTFTLPEDDIPATRSSLSPPPSPPRHDAVVLALEKEEPNENTSRSDAEFVCNHKDQSSCRQQEIQEALDTLLKGIELVLKLAAMDSSEYLKSDHHQQASNIVSKEDIQSRLDELQAKWALEETCLPSLVASIHRLQSNIGHLHQESTTFTSQMNEMHLSLIKLKNQNTKYKKALKKLYGMNQKLVEKLREKKRQSRHFRKTVQEFVSQKKQEELDTEEFLVACHESMMKSKIKQQQQQLQQLQQQQQNLMSIPNDSAVGIGTSTSIHQSGRNRSRTNTAESTFSDLDAYSYFGDYSIFQEEAEDDNEAAATAVSAVGDNLSCNIVPNSNTCKMRTVDVGTLEMPLIRGENVEMDHDGADISFDSSMSSVSASASASASSSRSLFVTDDNVATLSFSDVAHNHSCTFKTDHDTNDISTVALDKRTKVPNALFRGKSNLQTYTISFPSSQEIGLQFVQVPISKSVLYHHDPFLASRNLKKENRIRCFSDGAALDLAVVNEHEDRLESKNLSSTFATSRNGSAGIGQKSIRNVGQPFGGLTHSKSFPHHHTNKSSSFTIVENMFGFHSKMHKSKDDDAKVKHRPDHSTTCSNTAIVVSDFKGFDTSSYVRPTIGARLIAINDQSLLEGQWTVEKVTAVLKDIKAQSHDAYNVDRDIVLTFRNDPINGKLPKKIKILEEQNTCERTLVLEKEDSIQTDHRQQDNCKPGMDESFHVSSQDCKNAKVSTGVSSPVHTGPSKDGKDKKNSLSFFNLDSFTSKKDNDNFMSFFGITITKQSDSNSKLTSKN